MSSVQKIFDSVKRTCPTGIWAQGVKLARQDRVNGESMDDDEIVLRVKAPELPVAPTVVLYPGDEQWDCDCPSEADTCAHIAAATIALAQAHEKGHVLPRSARAGASVHYRFVNRGFGLELVRMLVSADDERQLDTSLHRMLAKPGTRDKLESHHVDLQIDSLLGPKPIGALPRNVLAKVLKLLAEHPDPTRITLDGKLIAVSGEELLPHAIFQDHKDGIELVLQANSEMDELVASGVVRCNNVLRVLGQTSITGSRLENLPLRRVYSLDSIVELVTEVLPQVEESAIVEIRTERMPRTTVRVKPRIDFDIQQDGASLTVLPTLVYGDPICARVGGERMVHVKGPVPVRDRQLENEIVGKLRDELHLLPGRRVTFNGNDASIFGDKLRKWQGRSGTGLELFQQVELQARLQIKNNSYELFFETNSAKNSGALKVSAEAVIGAWQGGLDHVPLQKGGWAPIPKVWLQEHGHRVADLLAARSSESKNVPLFAVPVLSELAESMGQTVPAKMNRLQPLIDGFEKLPKAELPTDLDATLRSYQEVGIDWLCFLRDAGLGAVLADDMGLGKTLQTICALKGRSLVVCPTSVLHNWVSEIARFRPGLSTAAYHGPGRKLQKSAKVVVTTYAILRIDNDILSQEKWDAVVLDEAQAIKNPSSQVAKAAYRMQGDFKVALSGTPVENRLEELWSLLHFTNRGLLGGYADFQNRYAKPIARGEPGSAERLRSKIRPFVLRRLKRDVAPELPLRTDSVLYVELNEDERVVYDAIRAATRKDVLEQLNQNGNVLAALEALLRLRQAACHAALIPGQHAESSSKIATLIEALETVAADDHKALVFSQWTSLLDLIEPHMHRAGIPFLRLDGSTRDRKSVVDGFQSKSGPPVLLASLKAGGTGLNLTAADHVFLTDPWWNPAAEDQAADRAHRIGQQRPVSVYRLVSGDTVEERILALQDRKRSLADAALGDADRAASLTRDDLLALLQ